MARMLEQVSDNAHSGTAEMLSKWPSPTCWLPAGIVQSDNLDTQGIGEIRHRRIIEGNVPVLSDSDSTNVDWRLGEEVAVAAALGLQIRRVAVEVVHGAERHTIGKPGLQPQPETRRMRHSHASILVEMQGFDRAPIEALYADQSVNELELGVTGAYHEARASAARDAAV